MLWGQGLPPNMGGLSSSAQLLGVSYLVSESIDKEYYPSRVYLLGMFDTTENFIQKQSETANLISQCSCYVFTA
jgi:hypothetical protein